MERLRRTALAIGFLALCLPAAICAAGAGTPATPAAEKSRGGATESPITLIARVGFDPDLSTVKINCWTRISVLMINEKKSLEGYLQIRKKEDEANTLIYRQAIALPIHSRKLWTGYIFADDDPNELLVEFYSKRGRRLAYEPVTYFARPLEDDLVLALIPPMERSGMRRFVTIAASDSSKGEKPTWPKKRGRYLLFTNKLLLPTEVIGYQSVSAFLWDGGDLAQLDKERSLALRGWIFQGGTLVVAGGENAQAIQQSFLYDILPVEVNGTDSAELRKDFLATFGSAPPSSEPLVIARAQLRRGRVIMGNRARPLIVEASYGAGRIVFTAFSLKSWALHNWKGKGREKFLGEIFGRGMPPLLATTSDEARTLIDARLKSNLLGKLPSPFFIVAFLGLYIILAVPVNYFVFLRRKRLEYAWAALPVLAIAFGFLAYNIGYFSQSQTLDADEITFVRAYAGNNWAPAKTFLSIYSPTRLNEMIRFPDRPVFARPLVAGFPFPMGGPGGNRPRGLRRNPLVVSYSHGFDVFDFVVYPWAARSLECDYLADLGGYVEADLALVSGALVGKITNRLPYTLEDPMLLLPWSNGIALGSFLAPGKSVDVATNNPNMKQPPTFAQTWFFDAINKYRRPMHTTPWIGPFAPNMLPIFSPQSDIYSPGIFGLDQASLIPPDRCLLVARAEKPLLEPAVGPPQSPRKLNRRNSTLIHFIILPIKKSTGAGITIGPDFWAIRPERAAPLKLGRGWDNPVSDFMTATSRYRNVFLLSAGESRFFLEPRLDLTGRIPERLEIEFKLEKKALYTNKPKPLPKGKFKAALYDFAEAKWTDFGSTTKIVVGHKASRYFDTDNKRVVLKIEVSDPEIAVGADKATRFGAVNAFISAIKATVWLNP